MIRKTVVTLTLLFVILLTISCVSATDNLINDIMCIDEDNQLNMEENLDFEDLDATNNVDNPDSYGIISVNEDSIISDEFDSDDQYEDLYLTDVNTYYNADYTDAYVTYCWDGYFNGKLVIYHGNSVVYSKIVQGNRIGSPTIEDCWMLNDNKGKPVPVGVYTVKLFSNNGTLLKTATAKINKAPTDFFVDSKTAKAGKQVTIKSYIEDDNGRAEYAKGKMTLKINGKTYSVNVKNGIFSISFKAPSIGKKYSCKLIYNGDSNYKSSSINFKLTVKKAPVTKRKKTTSFTVIVPVKLNKHVSKTAKGYKVGVYKYKPNNNKRIDIRVGLYKNSKLIKLSKYKGQVWLKSKSGKWIYWYKNNYGNGYSINALSYSQYLKINYAKVKIVI